MPRSLRNIGFAVLVLAALAPQAFAPNKSQSGGASQAAQNAEGKYAKYIFYDIKPSTMSPEMAAKMKEARQKMQSTVETTRLVDLDTTRAEGAPYLDFVWLWKGAAKGYTEQEHVHDFDEFLGFIGSK